MRAAVVSIGSELMHGVLTDTNATFLAQELTGLGLEVVEVAQVGDDLDRLIATFSRLVAEVDLIVSTGGLGPTDDDLTREALAAICGETPVVDPDLVEQIRAHFQARGLTMPTGNEKQAWLIPSAEAVPNPMGTAPGWFLHLEGRVVAAMPGPPRENQPMWAQRIAPRILAESIADVIVTRTIKTIGIGESAAEREIKDLVRRRMPIVATYAKSDGVHVRITAMAADHRSAREIVDAARQKVLQRLGPYVYGEDSDSLAYAILQPLLARNVQLALWEAGSAGRLSNLLQGDELVAAVVPESLATTYARAAQQLDPGAAPVRIALLAARNVAMSTGNGVGAALAVDIAADASLPNGYARGEIGLAFVHPDGELTREHAVNTVPEEIRRRATLWAAEFLLSAIRDATAVRSA